jgi:DNA-binding LacI/PurR family transcriptional regulator
VKPTLEDVAAEAGVSRATVSRVMNGSPRVSDGVRLTVQGAVERLGYVPNRAARTLVTQRTESVAFVVRETEKRVFSEPFFAGIVRAINNHITRAGYQMMLVMADPSDESAPLEHYLTDGHVDGVLLASMHGEDALLRWLLDNNLPTVVVGRPLGVDDVSSVDADNRGGARSAVDHLAGIGRSRIATITGPLDMGPGLDRYEGYLDGLKAAGHAEDDDLVVEGDFSQESGANGARRLLRERPDLDAVFAASDLMAAGALQELGRHGRRVPQDVAVIGFDDSSLAHLTDPPLSSVRQPLDEMGRVMTEMLLELMGDPGAELRRELLPTELVVRASTGIEEVTP